MCIYMYICVYIYMYVYICIYMYVYIYIYILVNIFTKEEAQQYMLDRGYSYHGRVLFDFQSVWKRYY